MKNEISLDKFTVQILPSDSRQILSLSVNEEGFFQLSRSLTEAIKGIPVTIRFTEDGKHLLLAHTIADDNAVVTFAKSGRRKLRSAAELMIKEHFSFPVRFSVWKREDENWQGDIQENPMQKLSGKHRLEKN